MVTITAAVVEQLGGDFELRRVRLDDPRPREALVRIHAAGICHTDLSARSGAIPFPLPGVLGHEGAGVVEVVGAEVHEVRPGDRVLLSFASCGRCRSCLSGHPAYCRHHLSLNLLGGSRLDGSPTMWWDDRPQPLHGHFFAQSSFAELALVDASCLVPVGPDAPLDLLAPLGCGLQTGAGAVLNVLRPAAASTLAVFGAGSVGLAAVMAAALLPLERIIAVDRLTDRLQLAQALGATDRIDTTTGDVVEAVRELSGGIGVDFAVETTGNTDVLRTATEVLAPNGTCAVIGAPRAGAVVSVDVNFMIPGRRLVGVTEGDSNPPVFIPTLIRLFAAGRFPLQRLVTHYKFSDIESAAADAAAGSAIKPVLVFNV